jgi:hypothetical protein
MRFINDHQFRALGLPGGPVTHWRKRKEGKLPPQREFGPKLRATPEPVALKYLEAIAAGHSEEQATVLAEAHLKTLLAQSHNAAA